MRKPQIGELVICEPSSVRRDNDGSHIGILLRVNGRDDYTIRLLADGQEQRWRNADCRAVLVQNEPMQ